MKKITNESLGAVHTHTHTWSLKENKKKNIKGITLVALVVTIIILLILSGISISVLTQTELFGKAKEAKQKSENAIKNENILLSNYNNKINSVVSNREQTTKDGYVFYTFDITKSGSGTTLYKFKDYFQIPNEIEYQFVNTTYYIIDGAWFAEYWNIIPVYDLKVEAGKENERGGIYIYSTNSSAYGTLRVVVCYKKINT